MVHVNGFIRVACTALLSLAALGASAQQAPTFTQRVKAEEALERVRYAHRIWPKENNEPKPPFDEVVPRAAIEARVTDYLRKSAALARLWGKPITPRDLQAEISRMAVHSKDQGRLQEMFDALGDDPVLIAECLARPELADRWVANRFEGGLPSGPLAHGSLQRTRAGFQDWWVRTAPTLPAFSASSDAAATSYTLPRLAGSACVEGWSPLAGSAPRGRDSAFYVYTGSEVILWGGYDGAELGSGARYDPATDTWVPISSGPGVPSARMAGPAGSVQAVWTGTEMIIWGGLTVSGGTTYLKTGGRYNPATDTWTPTSTGLFCPNERADHAVVWTGTEMVIWGGGQPYTNSGARYDPASDTWEPTSTGSGCPSPRAGQATVWTGSEMIVWGGESGGAPLADGARYAPGTDSWTPIASGAGAPSARAHATAVWTGSQMIVWGGDAPAALNSGGRYNPLSDSWTPTSSGTGCPAPRSGHGALWTGSEMIVWGGDGPAALETGGRYNPDSDAWTPTSTQSGCPTGRWGAVVVWTGTEMMVWGGADLSAGHPRTGGRYNPLTDAWTPTAVDGPSPRMNATAVWTGAEMIVWGGSDPTTRLGDGASYDPATDNWTALPGGPDCPSPREFHTAVWTGTEMIVWGGTDGGPYPGARYFNDGGRYDPATGLWSKTSTGVGCPPPRGWQTAVWTGNEMIVWGGNNGTVLLDTGGRYAPSTDSWQATSTAAGCPSPRNLHLAVWTGSEMIIWGGAHVAPRNIWTPLNTGSRYDPASDTWTAISAGAGCPAPRAGAQGVWTGTELVVWGGEGTNLPPVVAFDDGGRYDPQADGWQAISLAVGCPSGRLLHQAFWTGSEMIVWGGTTGAEYPQIGGRYDPGSDAWTATSSGSGCPQGRIAFSAVWTGGAMILWGGASGANYLSPGTVSGDGGIYTPGAGAFSCLASVVPSQGVAPLSADFTATVYPASCAAAPTYTWSFGDGATSTLQNPTHLYAAPGVYSWGVSATSGGLSAGDSGTVTVCDLQCSALVPAVGQVGTPLVFSAQGAESGGCNDAMTYLWSFGDGATSASPSATHAYTAPGPFAWALTVSAGGGSCSSSGTIAVATPPSVSGLRKAGSPFHIVVSGSGFQPGIQVLINGSPWPKVALKSSVKLKIDGGAALKASVPQGVPTVFRFVNPGGGEVSVTWNW